MARICTSTRERYRAWCGRRLDEHDLVYCFLDALYLKLRPDETPAEGVLVAWGVTLEGRKVLLGVAARKPRELARTGSTSAATSSLALSSRRRFWSPTARPGSGKRRVSSGRGRSRERCTVHALRNVTKKLPERLHRELKARYWSILDEASSPAEARAGLLALVADYQRAFPSAMAVIERELEALVCHLRFPSEHRKRVRSTNLLERTFVEVRRRTKVIGRFPGETSALCLIWAVLELSSRGWRGVVMTPRAVAEIERLRRALAADRQPDDEAQEEVVAA